MRCLLDSAAFVVDLSTVTDCLKRVPASSRFAVRPEIDDGAALARGTRDPDTTCVRLLDPGGTRAPRDPPTNGSNGLALREWARRARRGRRICSARSGRAWHFESRTTRCRAERDPNARWARLLDPGGTRAPRDPPTNGSNGLALR
jgi:hypothetical protein